MKTVPKNATVTRLRARAPAKKATVTKLRPPPRRQPKERISSEEWQARVELAAAYRLCAIMGWTDMISTHLSCRVPGRHDQFLINPYGLMFEEITASSLLKIDVEGNKLSESPYNANRAGFVIHSAVHMGRADAHCVMHLHTHYGTAVSMQKQGLLPISQQALTVMSLLKYHSYEGVAFDTGERERLLEDLGPDGAMLILRNHGTLTLGETVGEAFARMNRLERACRLQVLALSGGAEPNPVAQEVVDHAMAQGPQIYGKGGQSAGGALVWSALLRKLDRENPGYDT
ncbi:MAG TPA: class II aldolase/adducin family protein [Burkholderiales bacterium]|nr:class II aldolase/adducin family protein [Burkholderiales bacterium]